MNFHLLHAIVFLAVLLFFAWLSWRRRTRRHRRKIRQAGRILAKLDDIPHPGQRLAYLRKIDPYTFEELLLEVFERRGFTIQRNKRYSGDGGLDGKVWCGDELYLIQAKRYSNLINKRHVLEFIELVERFQCKGFFCHTGRTSSGSKDLFNGHSDILMLSGSRLLDFIDLDKPFSINN
ncbi:MULTISPECIES: restriction endonuclease [Serratia]|uniref:restriction endonuclease n=1 Tax=Serratia TaxID=613 RepID=UPI000F7E7522|nr:restriction endonuclease [Serratia marcescens]RTF27444.1 restriction endonuclease [Serratia marcescens]HDL6704445.1 restriction endonuclease [Yersinia enterocolitica]